MEIPVFLPLSSVIRSFILVSVRLSFSLSFICVSVNSSVILFWSPVRKICRPVDLFRVFSLSFERYNQDSYITTAHWNGYKCQCHAHTSEHMWTCRLPSTSSPYFLLKWVIYIFCAYFLVLSTFVDRVENWMKKHSTAHSCTRFVLYWTNIYRSKTKHSK